jgi:glucose-1-phosphate cytidylyltransferase
MQVVILCGGKGTRSYPFTEYLPKVMMPINGSPIIVHLMKIYASQGFTDFVLAAGHRQEMLRDYFQGRFNDWKITIVDTGEASDTGERIRRCAPYVGERFFATYGDGLGDVDLHRLLKFHREAGGLATLTTVPLRSQYGSVHFGPDGLVDRFQEKPIIRDYWINAGYFVFEKKVFDHWKGQNLESEVFPELAKTNRLYSYLHDGFWKSMDTSKDQQELEVIYRSGNAPWVIKDTAQATAAAAAAGVA